MSSLLAFFFRRRGRLAVAALLTVLVQLPILLLPGLAEARPFLSAFTTIAVPTVLVFFPTSSSAEDTFVGHSFHRENVLGTSLDLYVSTTSADQAQQCESAVLEEIARLEQILSTREPDSEISRLNRGETPSTGSPELLEVLTLCEHHHQVSNGAFDARLGGLVRAWREAEQADALPDEARLRDLLSRRHEQPYHIDALGKAFVLDRAARRAQARTGVRGLLLNIGGDIVALGDCNANQGRGWVVGVAHPGRPEDNALPLAHLRLRNQAVATSAAYGRPVLIQGVSHSHILDPRTGQPAAGVASATVVAADAATANALATTLCVLSPEDGLRLVARTDQAACLLVAADGTEVRSPGLVETTIATAVADTWPEGNQLTVKLALTKPTTGKKIVRPYVAVWIEDADGNPVKTLAVWGNERKYLRDLSAWWKFASKDDALVKAVTKATRAAGDYALVWNGTDDKGNALAPGTYTVRVEVNREHGRHVQQSGKVECGEKKVTVTLDATAETGVTKVQYGPNEK